MKRKKVNSLFCLFDILPIIFIFVSGNSIKELNLRVMENRNFGSEFDNKYLVVINGNEVVFSHSDKKPALRSFRARSRSSSYVELWYQFDCGRCVLMDYNF